MDFAQILDFISTHAFASGFAAGIGAGLTLCGLIGRQVEKRHTEISRKPIYCDLPHQRGLAGSTVKIPQRINVKTGKCIAIECPFYRKDSFLIFFSRHRCAAMGGNTCLHFRRRLEEEEKMLISEPPPAAPHRVNPSVHGWVHGWRR